MTKGLNRSLNRAKGSSMLKRIVCPIVAKTATITDPGSANAPFTLVVGELPEGNILVHGAIAYLQLTRGDTDITTTFTGNVALGSAPTADATLNGSEVDLIASTAITAATSGVSATKRYSNATPVMLDNTDGSLEINLNGFIADAAISADSSVIVDGSVELLVSVLGDD